MIGYCVHGRSQHLRHISVGMLTLEHSRRRVIVLQRKVNLRKLHDFAKFGQA